MSIEFTQYHSPNGKTSQVVIDMPPDVEEKANQLVKAGCHFDIEILSTGVVSMTCETVDDLVSIRLCSNGPKIPQAVTDLIEDATNKIFQKEK